MGNRKNKKSSPQFIPSDKRELKKYTIDFSKLEPMPGPNRPFVLATSPEGDRELFMDCDGTIKERTKQTDKQEEAD